MERKTFALIRKDRNTGEICEDLLELPASILDEGGEDAALQYLEGIASDYIYNGSGKDASYPDGRSFTWHDFACIPETFLARYGVRFHQHFAAEVDGMEEIGSKVKPILYQVIDEKSRAQNGNYKTDWDDLIDRAPDNECREYLTETRKKMKAKGISFAYNMVYVTRMACGHYEIFQCPGNMHRPIAKNLREAREYSLTHKCSACIIGRKKEECKNE